MLRKYQRPRRKGSRERGTLRLLAARIALANGTGDFYTAAMPEKSTNEIPRPIRELFAKGKEAVDRDNLDYAFKIFEQVLQQEPAYFECRETLRNAQIAKTGKGGGFFKKIVNTANPLLAKAQIELRNNPKDAMATCEQMLNGDANNWSAHKILAEAAMALDLPRTAILSLEMVRRNNAKDRDAAIVLANAYIKSRQASKAAGIYDELLKANPKDTDALQLSKGLAAQRTMDEQGYAKLEGGGGSYRDVLKDKDESVRLEQEARTYKDEDTTTAMIDRKYDELKADPSNLTLARELGDLYVQAKDYTNALKYYKMLAEIPGTADSTLDRAINSVTVKLIDARLEQLDKTAPDYEEQAAELQREKDRYQFEDCKRRSEKYPNDLGVKYELGTHYFKLGQITEAIQEFQKSQRDPHRRLQSVFHLGKCFAARGMNEMAVRQLTNAINEKLGMDEEKKDMIYTLACVLEKSGKKEDALKQFERIYEIDITYRDVGKRVDDYYSGGSAQS